MTVADGCQGTYVYTMATIDFMNHITIKHRQITITIWYLMQSWMGLPRKIRPNAINFVIHKTGDIKQTQLKHAK